VWGTVDVNGLPVFYETEGTGGPITYQAMAEETVGLLRTMALGPSDLVGWSDGGMVAFLVATSHPDLVHTLTLVGSRFWPAQLAVVFCRYSYRVESSLASM
jgi:pimeloyl-ACP methyl ester carboxylesterase